VVLSILSEERSLDPETLRELCRQKLLDWGVTIVHAEASRAVLERYDHVISAVYSNPNLLRHPRARREHHFSLSEMVLVELPEQYAGRSAMIVYGPFMTVDVSGRPATTSCTTATTASTTSTSASSQRCPRPTSRSCTGTPRRTSSTA
jgi:hypothetical protein